MNRELVVLVFGSHPVMVFCSNRSVVQIVGVFESGSFFRGNPSCEYPLAVDAFLIAGLLYYSGPCPHRCVRVYNQLYHSDSPDPLIMVLVR